MLYLVEHWLQNKEQKICRNILILSKCFYSKIIEGGTLRTTVLGEVTLPSLDVDVAIDKVGLTSVDFVSSVKFKHDHAGSLLIFFG